MGVRGGLLRVRKGWEAAALETARGCLLAAGLDLLAGGPFERVRVEQVRGLEDELEPTLRSMVAREVARAWEQGLEEAAARGRRLFDGPTLRYRCHRAEAGELWIGVEPSSYRWFYGTNLQNGWRCVEVPGPLRAGPAGRWPWEALDSAVGISALIRSADGALVLGRRSGSVAFHAGCLHMIGGMLEAQDRAVAGGAGGSGRIDPERAILRELEEEAGLQPGEVGLRGLGLLRDRVIWQPELVFEACSSLGAAELSERIGRVGDEHTEACTLELDADRLVDELASAMPLAPVAFGAVLLLGMELFGPVWGRGAVERLADLRSDPPAERVDGVRG